MLNWQDRSRDLSLEAPPLRIPSLIWRILSARGIQTTDELKSLMNFGFDQLTDPSSMASMPMAVERLVEALEKQQKVLVYADFDMDGTPALALLRDGLRALGFQTVYGVQPDRLKQGYGLHKDILAEYQERGVELVITVDVGITAVESSKWAKEAGLDLIITDHHIAPEVLPEALAIINPNQEACESGLGHLCGTGVAFFLVMALRRELRKRAMLNVDFDPRELLDLYAIGTIADLVPLTAENRILVRHGLHQLEHTKRPGLQALLKELGLNGRPLNSQDVAMRLVPKLNALSRMEMSLRPVEILEEMDADRAKKKIKEVMRVNKLRVSMQQTAMQEAVQMVFEKEDLGSSICLYSSTFHKGVIGLVAVKLAEEHSLPAFIGSLKPETGQVAFSSRLPAGSSLHLVEILKQCEDLLDKFGGHKMAAGFELSESNIPAFQQRLSEVLKDADTAPVPRKFDAPARLRELNQDFMGWLDRLEPFGQAFESIVVSLPSVALKEIKELRGGHLRLRISDGTAMMNAVWFSPPKFENLEVEDRFSLIVEPQWNFFAGRKSVQLMVVDGQRIEN